MKVHSNHFSSTSELSHSPILLHYYVLEKREIGRKVWRTDHIVNCLTYKRAHVKVVDETWSTCVLEYPQKQQQSSWYVSQHSES